MAETPAAPWEVHGGNGGAVGEADGAREGNDVFGGRERNMRTRTTVLAVAALVAGGMTPLQSGPGDLELPAALAHYREWT